MRPTRCFAMRCDVMLHDATRWRYISYIVAGRAHKRCHAMIGGDAMVCPDDATRCDETAEGRKSAGWRYVSSSDDGRYWRWIHPFCMTCIYKASGNRGVSISTSLAPNSEVTARDQSQLPQGTHLNSRRRGSPIGGGGFPFLVWCRLFGPFQLSFPCG